MNPEKPLVSILMLSFNYGHYLTEAVDSVLRQTYSCWELIVVDDGSRDNSLAVLERLAVLHPERIRVFTHPGNGNCGIAASCALALSKARGQFTAFLESDDIWKPDALEKKIRVFLEHPRTGTVFSSYEPFGEKRPVLYWRLYGFLIRRSLPQRRLFSALSYFLARNPAASFSNFMTRRTLLDRVPAPPGRMKNYDWWVLGHLSAMAPFYFLPEKLTRWRIHRKSAAYGRVSQLTLGRLLFFLKNYYAALRRMSTESRSNPRIVYAEAMLARVAQKEQRRPWLFLKSMAAHPWWSVRFLGFILLRGLLF